MATSGGSTVEFHHLTELDFSDEPSTNNQSSQDNCSSLSSSSFPRTGTNMTAEDWDSLLRGNVALEVMINVADVAHHTMQNF
eukprot:scaffold5662_cov57-Attheya_sp.AAC.4